MSKRKQMKLMAYLKTGPTAVHNGAWKHPASDLSNIFKPERYEHIARVLEAARFDGCFYADTLGLPDIYKGSYDTYLHYGGQLSYLDPFTFLPVMARDSATAGRMPRSTCTRPASSKDQRRSTTLNRPVPEASETSLAYSPVSSKRT